MPTADALAQRVKEVVEEVDGITDAKVSRESGTPEEIVVVDRQKAADLKLTVSQIAETLQTALSGTRASDYRELMEAFLKIDSETCQRHIGAVHPISPHRHVGEET